MGRIGARVGEAVSAAMGLTDGARVGARVGEVISAAVGFTDGARVGARVSLHLLCENKVGQYGRSDRCMDGCMGLWTPKQDPFYGAVISG